MKILIIKASSRCDVIINVIKNLDYQASPRLDMIISVMKISIKK